VEAHGGFGDLLRRRRAAAGLSQAALAARSGLSVEAISLLERGQRLAPRNSTVIRLANALRVQGPEREALVEAAQASRRRRTSSAAPGPLAPHELPRSPADFTGRTVELARLLDDINAGGAAGEYPVVITAVDGMGGVGKSALAIHAAHRLVAAGAFPDGELYLNLRGSSPGLPPLEPLDALAQMLRSLGIQPSAIPAGVEEAAARFRTLTNRRRLLIVLDNARSAEQVRPLLPSSPTCGVLITSRQVLATLEGSRPLHLDVLSPEQGVVLLGRVARRELGTTELQAAAEVVACCGGLPLAVRIAGARLAARPGWPVRELAGQLADASRRIEELEAAELAVRASFDVSLSALRGSSDPVDRAAAAAFGLLSLPDGPDMSAVTAARTLDVAETQAETVLLRLVDAQLLDSPRPGRYQFHDLMRLYAREHARRLHDEPARTAALVRCVGFYIATSWSTLALLRPGDWRLQAADPRWAHGGLEFDGAPAALDWAEAERANLLAAVVQAAEAASATSAGLPAALPGQLVSALFGFFLGRGHWRDWIRASETVLNVARRHGDLAAQASALNDLGVAHERLSQYAEAVACQEQGLAIARELGDPRGQSAALGNLGLTYCAWGRYPEALSCEQECLGIYRAMGDRRGQAIGLINIGIVHQRLGRYAEAIACQQESVSLFRELGDRQGEAWSLTNLGVACVDAGRHAEAVPHLQEGLAIARELGHPQGQANSLNGLGQAYEGLGRAADAIECQVQSLAIFRDLGDRRGQATALRDLGDARRTLGRLRQARLDWREALEIFDELQVPEAAEIRARLAD
jgi:tetratricopeptide (TPR) repeat protein/transcriptional regulator with XRE-family HTH domain